MEEAGKQVSCAGFGPRASLSRLWVRESFRAIKLLTVRIGWASDLLKTSHRITGVGPNKTTASVSPAPSKPEYIHGRGKKKQKTKMLERQDREQGVNLIRSH